MAGDLHSVASGSRLPKPGAGSGAGHAGSGRVMVMGIQQERTDRIDALRGLIERLCAPDLTLAEAKVLRARLSDLLEPAACDQLASSPALVASRGRGDISEPPASRSRATRRHAVPRRPAPPMRPGGRRSGCILDSIRQAG